MTINRQVLQRIGTTTFAFFLAKGLLWIVAAWFLF